MKFFGYKGLKFAKERIKISGEALQVLLSMLFSLSLLYFEIFNHQMNSENVPCEVLKVNKNKEIF